MIPNNILRKLSGLRFRERLLQLFWGLAVVFSLALGLLLLGGGFDYLIDRFQETPWPVRIFLFILQSVILVGAVVYFILRPLFRRLSNNELALWVEEKHPSLDHRLISAVQLNRKGADHGGMSEELIGEVTKEAENQSHNIPFGSVADHSRIGKGLKVGLPMASLFALPFFFFPTIAPVLFQRQLLNDVEIPRLYSLEPAQWELVRPAGEKVEVQFQAKGPTLGENHPGTVFVHPREGRGDRYPLEFVEMTEEGAIYKAEIPGYAVDFDYSGYLGDARMKKSGQVKMVQRPIVTDQEAWVQLPPFCGLRPDGKRYEVVQSQGDITGIPGSTVRLEIQTQKPVKEAFIEILTQEIIPDKEEPGPEKVKRTIALEPYGDGTKVRGSFDLKKDEHAYRVIVIDENGFNNVPAPRRGLRVHPEEAPTVYLLKEQLPPDGPIPPGTSLEDFEIDGLPIIQGVPIRIAYIANGPYGLGRAKFLWRIVKKIESGNEEVQDEEWSVLDLVEYPAKKINSPFDPRRGVFEKTTTKESVFFHAVPSNNPDTLLGRTFGGGRFDFQTKTLIDRKGNPLKLNAGDQMEFCVEITADKEGDKKNRPFARSETRLRTIINENDFLVWFLNTAQEERQIRQIDQKQRGVFEEK